MIHPIRVLAAAMLLACIAGCVSAKWPPFDEKKAQFILLSGEFSGTRALDENPCLFTDELIESGVADCWNGTPSISTLQVYEVMYGHIYDTQLRVAYHPSLGGPTYVPGNPVLALVATDGRYYVLQRLHGIAQTFPGEWALPVETDLDLAILPCGARPLVKPLDFSRPRPGTLLETYGPGALEDLKSNPHVEIRDGHAYITHGILLRDLQRFMTTATPKSPEAYQCPEYE